MGKGIKNSIIAALVGLGGLAVTGASLAALTVQYPHSQGWSLFVTVEGGLMTTTCNNSTSDTCEVTMTQLNKDTGALGFSFKNKETQCIGSIQLSLNAGSIVLASPKLSCVGSNHLQIINFSGDSSTGAYSLIIK